MFSKQVSSTFAATFASGTGGQQGAEDRVRVPYLSWPDWYTRVYCDEHSLTGHIAGQHWSTQTSQSQVKRVQATCGRMKMHFEELNARRINIRVYVAVTLEPDAQRTGRLIGWLVPWPDLMLVISPLTNVTFPAWVDIYICARAGLVNKCVNNVLHVHLQI